MWERQRSEGGQNLKREREEKSVEGRARERQEQGDRQEKTELLGGDKKTWKLVVWEQFGKMTSIQTPKTLPLLTPIPAIYRLKTLPLPPPPPPPCSSSAGGEMPPPKTHTHTDERHSGCLTKRKMKDWTAVTSEFGHVLLISYLQVPLHKALVVTNMNNYHQHKRWLTLMSPLRVFTQTQTKQPRQVFVWHCTRWCGAARPVGGAWCRQVNGQSWRWYVA